MNVQRGKKSSSFIHVSAPMLKILYCQEQSGTFAEVKKAWMDGQNGERDFLTFITWELIKGGEVIIFIWKGERKGGGLFLAFTPQGSTRLICSLM